MLNGHNIICFSADWDQDPLSKHHIMSRLAKQNKVLWINSIGMRKPTATSKDFVKVVSKINKITQGLKRINNGLYVYTPLLFPFHDKLFVKINNILLKHQIRALQVKLHLNNPLLWTFLPNMVNLLGFFEEIAVIYYCTDDFTEFEGYSHQSLALQEQMLIRKADISFYTAKRLMDNKCITKEKSFLLRHGVDLDHFKKAWETKQTKPLDLSYISKPIIGFWGELNESLNYELIKNVALLKPEWSFVLIGGSNYAGSRRLPIIQGIKNIFLLGQKPYNLLPVYAAFFDVAIVPKNDSELSLNMNPLKLREYLAAGVPVVSAPLPEVLPYGDVVKFAATAEEYIIAIGELLKQDRKVIAPKLSARVAGEGWDVKVEEISKIIEEELLRHCEPRSAG